MKNHDAARFLLSLASALVVLAMAWGQGASAEDISTSGWRLWPDQAAKWQDDTIYLPAEVRLDRMPVNPPTGGWAALTDQQGIAVTLPSTVEEHFWGKLALRPYAKNEAQIGPRTDLPNGNYLGVSWWWRQIQVPDFKPGQRVVASFRGARLRAEVYCNQKLCGYTIMTELPFTADLTDAVKPGQPAQLAVRITNPGGHFDWLDFGAARFSWGKYLFPPSRGFGGLDENIQLDVRDNVSVTDLAALDTPDLHTVHLVAEVASVSQPYQGPVHFAIGKAGQAVWSGDAQVTLAAGETRNVELDAKVDSAEPWDLDHPNLYTASAALEGLTASRRAVDFGFRFFTADGIGTDNARLTLNGKRIVVLSAISWGFWGRNGLWPDAEMAGREVSDAKAMGLNCLNFHRNIGKPAVLDLQDRQGLLRVEEPGGGKFVIGARYARGPFGPSGEFLDPGEGNDCLSPAKDYKEPDSVDTSGKGPDGDGVVFWEKYEEEKIMRMVKRDRSHPSLILYTLQNESSELDLRNPRIYRIFRRMHALDPSRIINFFSGGVPDKAQVLMLPYSDEIRYGSKTLPFAGWRDCHTCGGPCNYLDNLYTDPQHFVQKQPADARKLIKEWGEMLGAATPDDYDKLVHSFDAAHPTGYELEDMKPILNGYHQFLDKYGFREAFPTDSALFQAIGNRGYYFWQRIIEQSRADNSNDMLVISGWESTTIDNHSGLVDNHRFFKGDPAVIAKATKPAMLFIQPRHMIVATGEKDLVDVYLLNNTGIGGGGVLNFTVTYPDGTEQLIKQQFVPIKGGDVFGDLVAEGIEVQPGAPGMLKLHAHLAVVNGPEVVDGRDEIEVIDVGDHPPEPGRPLPLLLGQVLLHESGNEIAKTLSDVFQVKFNQDLPPSTPASDIVTILSTKAMSRSLAKPADKPDPKLAAQVSETDFDNALDIAKRGGRMVLWPDNNVSAEVFAKALSERKIVTFAGMVGNRNAPWFGSWFFVRQHLLLQGLPVDCAMDWRYGISAFNGSGWTKEQPGGTQTDGMLLDAPEIEVFIGYGADHRNKVGISGCVIPYGKGQVVLYCLPQLVRSLAAGDNAISLPIARRLLFNALSYGESVDRGLFGGHPAVHAKPTDPPVPFEGVKSDWHGFDRYDYLLDEQTLAIKPVAENTKGDVPGQRRCIVVVPKQAAPGNPWSWRGCYWDHQPQAEIELLKRGFHIAYISADASRKPDQKWDAWYRFLTDKHGLSIKPAFVGMSRGGEYAYLWATTHPDKVSCIYGDNPGGNSDNLARLEALAANDVPLLHVCGTIDPILYKYSTTIETIYQQFGGRISVMIKEGNGHHPHSLSDPTPIADFIVQSVHEATTRPSMPAYAGKGSTKSYYYSLDNSYLNFPAEGNYLTCRGPLFTPCYDRYELWIGFEVPVVVIAPEKEAAGRPWVFRADQVTRDAVVDQALLAKGFHIVTGPTGYNSDGPRREDWDKLYKYLTDNGFSKKPVMEGAGGATGEVYAWAIENPDKVSCIYGENPVLRSHNAKIQPLDNLAPLAKAGVPILHVCGSLDPFLNDQTRVAEKRYKDLGGQMTVIIQEGVGHFPLAPKDPKPVVDFLTQKVNP